MTIQPLIQGKVTHPDSLTARIHLDQTFMLGLLLAHYQQGHSEIVGLYVHSIDIWRNSS
jgi:hypothetical protein